RGANVGEGLPWLRDKFPAVVAGAKREFQNTECGGVADFAVWMRFLEGTMVLAASADNEFTNATRHVGFAVGSLRSEAFVIVIMAADDDVGVGVKERLPQGFNHQIVTVSAAGTEERLMKISKRARDGMGKKVSAEPFFLARTGFAAADFGALAIENDDVPGAEIVAVITVVRIAGGCAKVLEIISCAFLMKFVIARSGACAILYAAPGFVVANEVLLAAVGIGKVAGGEDSAGDLFEELGCGFGAGEVPAVGNIAGADEDGGGGVRHGVFDARGGARKSPRAKDSG